MSDRQQWGPTDPLAGDDLLAPDQQDEELDDEELEPPRPRRPFGRFAWTALAVVAILGLLIAGELVRISTALDNSACVQQAEAHLLETVGPGVSPPYAALDRLTAVNQLAKC